MRIQVLLFVLVVLVIADGYGYLGTAVLAFLAALVGVWILRAIGRRR